MNGVAQLQRQSSDYYMNAMNGGMAVPTHLRPDMQSNSRAPSPAQYSMAVNGQQQRPQLTSNPSSGYNPPQILEPPAANGQQQTGSGTNSPHMSTTVGWQSPHHGMTTAQTADYTYPDGYSQVNAAQMYYQPRPHSTAPMDYRQMPNQEVWATQHQQ